MDYTTKITELGNGPEFRCLSCPTHFRKRSSLFEFQLRKWVGQRHQNSGPLTSRWKYIANNLDLRPLYRGHWSKFGKCLLSPDQTRRQVIASCVDLWWYQSNGGTSRHKFCTFASLTFLTWYVSYDSPLKRCLKGAVYMNPGWVSFRIEFAFKSCLHGNYVPRSKSARNLKFQDGD